MRLKAAAILLFLVSFTGMNAQLYDEDLGFFEKAEVPNRVRIRAAAAGKGIAIGGAYLGLYQLWYKDQSTGSFHLHNDWNNWQQVDKLGHAFSAYQLGYLGMQLQEWAGVSRRKSMWIGAGTGFAFLAGVEVLDAYSDGWGFSWGDMGANAAGTALLVGQELLWNEQRVVMKFSYQPTRYASENASLLGHNHAQRLLKDYNGQTYWLSANIHSLSGWGAWPAWLNLAAGYGADGMVTARYLPEFYNARQDLNWQRQYYLSLDIDLRKIPVKSPFLKTLFKAVNLVKVPLPTLEFNAQKGVRFHPLYF